MVVMLLVGLVYFGDLYWVDGWFIWQLVGGLVCELEIDCFGKFIVVDYENLLFFVVDCDGCLVVCVCDCDWVVKQVFVGLDYFFFDLVWVIEVVWQLLVELLMMEVFNVVGDLKIVEVVYQVVFVVVGECVVLLLMLVGESEVFFVFCDWSSGKEIYGVGCFLKVFVFVDGKIIFDFNYVYNLFCVFMFFVICLLLLLENWLLFVVLVGEKKWIKLVQFWLFVCSGWLGEFLYMDIERIFVVVCQGYLSDVQEENF